MIPHDIENMFRIFARDLMEKLITQPLIRTCRKGIHISSDASTYRRILVVTAISILVVILILFAFMMESGMPITSQEPGQDPYGASLFLPDRPAPLLYLCFPPSHAPDHEQGHPGI